MGFKRAFVPPKISGEIKSLAGKGFSLEPVATLKEAFDRYF